MQTNKAILLVGSNIEPQKNIASALLEIRRLAILVAHSRVWETAAVGSDGPNFLNLALEIKTLRDPQQIKNEIITPVENKLHRVRSTDKYAPRTIDIDVIVYNNEVLDQNLWEKAFVALPVVELAPHLLHPVSGLPLSTITEQLKSSTFAELFSFHPDFP